MMNLTQQDHLLLEGCGQLFFGPAAFGDLAHQFRIALLERSQVVEAPEAIGQPRRHRLQQIDIAGGEGFRFLAGYGKCAVRERHIENATHVSLKTLVLVVRVLNRQISSIDDVTGAAERQDRLRSPSLQVKPPAVAP